MKRLFAPLSACCGAPSHTKPAAGTAPAALAASLPRSEPASEACDLLSARRQPTCFATGNSTLSTAPAPPPPPHPVRAWVSGSNTPCDNTGLNATDIVATPRIQAVHAAIIARLWERDPGFTVRLPDRNLMHLCAAFPHVSVLLQAHDPALQGRLQALQGREARCAVAAASEPAASEASSSDWGLDSAMESESETPDTDDEEGARAFAIAHLDATSAARQCAAVLHLKCHPGSDAAEVHQTCVLLREHLARCAYPHARVHAMYALERLLGARAAPDIEPFLFDRHPGVASRARCLMRLMGQGQACALAQLWHSSAQARIEGIWEALSNCGRGEACRPLTALLVLQALVEPAPEVRKELLTALVRLRSRQAFDIAGWYALEADTTLARFAHSTLVRLGVVQGGSKSTLVQ